MDDQEDQCLKALDDWIKIQKDTVYERNFKGPNNDSSVLQNYKDELSVYCSNIKRAIWSNDLRLLERLGWNQQLIDCSRNANMRLEMCDRIHEWLITFPNVKNARHLDILLGEQ
jgi:hypothetical protein